MSLALQERNKALVLEAFDALFNKRDYRAAERYWSPDYVQHSGRIGPGRDGLFDLIKSMPTTLKHEAGMVVADGDLVMLHGRFSGFGAPANWIAVDILRVADGVLVEHWDVIQDEAIEEESRSGRPMFGDVFPPSRPPPEVTAVKKRPLTAALEKADLPAAAAFLRHDVVFHSPILATVGDVVRGQAVVVEILTTGFACFGSPRNVQEFQNPDGRYIVTFDGAIAGNLIQITVLVTEDAANKVESLRFFARPWPVVKLFREYMERNLRPDPVPDAIWDLPGRASSL